MPTGEPCATISVDPLPEFLVRPARVTRLSPTAALGPRAAACRLKLLLTPAPLAQLATARHVQLQGQATTATTATPLPRTRRAQATPEGRSRVTTATPTSALRGVPSAIKFALASIAPVVRLPWPKWPSRRYPQDGKLAAASRRRPLHKTATAPIAAVLQRLGAPRARPRRSTNLLQATTRAAIRRQTKPPSQQRQRNGRTLSPGDHSER